MIKIPLGRVDFPAVKRLRVGLLGVPLGAIAYISLIGIPFGPKAAGDVDLARSAHPGQRVLFVGNSLTYYNGMPTMVRRLAASDAGAPTLFVAQYTAPGWDLKRASGHDGLRALLGDVRWDDVVLQEHSGVRRPFVHELHRRITARGGRTVIFDRGDGASAAAQALGAALAPVGTAVDEALAVRPDLDLFADDRGHPNRAGSFLIACVFYAVLTDRDPSWSGYSGGLEASQAAFLKAVAWEAVRR